VRVDERRRQHVLDGEHRRAGPAGPVAMRAICHERDPGGWLDALRNLLGRTSARPSPAPERHRPRALRRRGDVRRRHARPALVDAVMASDRAQRWTRAETAMRVSA
jgi:hypothetical protein